MTTSSLEQPAYGQLVRERREERNQFPSEVAAEVRISPGYLRNIELGTDPVPSRRVRIALARVLDCPELAHPSEPPKQPKRDPKGPTRRQETEQERKGPRRVAEHSGAVAR